MPISQEIDDPRKWRISMPGYSIKTGWGNEGRIVVNCHPAAMANDETFKVWLADAEAIVAAHNTELEAGSTIAELRARAEKAETTVADLMPKLAKLRNENHDLAQSAYIELKAADKALKLAETAEAALLSERKDAERYRLFREIGFDDDFDAYDPEGLDAELDHRLALAKLAIEEQTK